MGCDPEVGARSPPCATKSEMDALWSGDVELQFCLRDTLSAVGGDDIHPWRCPLFLPLPDQTWLVRVEVYLQLHLAQVFSRWRTLLEEQSEIYYLKYDSATSKTKKDQS